MQLDQWSLECGCFNLFKATLAVDSILRSFSHTGKSFINMKLMLQKKKKNGGGFETSKIY